MWACHLCCAPDAFFKLAAGALRRRGVVGMGWRSWRVWPCLCCDVDWWEWSGDFDVPPLLRAGRIRQGRRVAPGALLLIVVVGVVWGGCRMWP